MVLDSKITQLKHYFGIMKPEDWQGVEPGWILRQDGIGPVTLDHVRIYLAARGLTLKNDRTPEYWQQHLAAAKIGHTLGDPDVAECDMGLMCPFTILIDSAEQQALTFQGLRSDSDNGGRPLIVPTEWRCLGRHPDSKGDYSIDGFIGRIGIERKSTDDAHGTILGWDGRRERFECELGNLQAMEAAIVVVECSFSDLIRLAPSRGKKSAAQNAKTLHRSVIAFMQDYRVPWAFCDGRRMAEVTAFRFLERFHRKQAEIQKAAEREAKKAAKQAKQAAEAESAKQLLMTL